MLSRFPSIAENDYSSNVSVSHVIAIHSAAQAEPTALLVILSRERFQEMSFLSDLYIFCWHYATSEDTPRCNQTKHFVRITT